MQIAPWVFPLTEETASVPPHVRRKASTVRFHTDRAGITPACAGKSREEPPHVVRTWDHPRVCGEKSVGLRCPAWMLGSPPRVRGKVAVIAATDAMPRDHPRVCGEKGLPVSVVPRYQGSPPRVRGKARENGCFGAAEEDHPRVCGEKIIRGAHRLLNKGSPPRVRGKVILIVSISSSMRITPACAGKRTLADAKAASCRDHPRVCGEKTKESLKK